MLIEAVRDVARAAPERAALVADAGTSSYAELADRSAALATGLAQRGLTRFGVAVSDRSDAIALLAASSLLGAEACVYPAAIEADERDQLASRLEHPAVITDAELPQLAGTPFEGAAPADGSVMILTTGTTGPPKGARHEWARLLSGVRRGVRPGARWLLAYNLNQFAGMQVLLHALANGGVARACRRPTGHETRLASMRAHGVTHASATPTFWRFLTTLLDDGEPVPALEQITLGGEAIPPGLARRADRAGSRRPASRRSTRPPSSAARCRSVTTGIGLPIDVLDRGDDADVQFQIVDGELYARSRVGMLGYHGDDGADPDGWRPTGDVVEVEGDRILFVGRTSEIINVGGRQGPPPARRGGGRAGRGRRARAGQRPPQRPHRPDRRRSTWSPGPASTTDDARGRHPRRLRGRSPMPPGPAASSSSRAWP